jgi:hypothetical protein
LVFLLKRALLRRVKYFGAGVLAIVVTPALAASHDELDPSILSLRIGITAPAIPLTLQPEQGSSRSPIAYDQNSAAKLGLGADYSWLGVFLSVSNLQSDLDIQKYGESTYSDFQLHSYMGALGLDLFYQDFSGYYLRNTTEISGDTCCILRDDLNSRFIGANLFWTLRPERLSLGTTNNLTGVQRKSGGSWMLLMSVGHQEIQSDAVFAPSGFEQDYGLLGNARKAKFTTTTLGSGYGYTGILVGNFFFHITGLLGLGPQKQELITRDYGDVDTWNISAKFSLRSTLGWSARRTFGGIQVLFDSTNFQLEGENLSFNSVLTFLSIGFRLGT